MRLLLAISVVIAHSEPLLGLKFVGGSVAVQIFFIISGFYMAMVLNTKYIGPGSYKLFISNRFLRLFPSYIAVVFLTLFLSILAYNFADKGMKLSIWIENFDLLNISTFISLVLTNIIILGQDIVMFTGINNIDGTFYFLNDFNKAEIKTWSFLVIPQAWSISIELMFYFIAPFIVRKSVKTILIFIFLSILFRAFIYFYLGWIHDPWTYRFFPLELALFLFGSISYRLYEKIKKMEDITSNSYYVSLLVIYFLLIIFYQFIPVLGHFKNWLIYVLSIPVIPILFILTKKNKLDYYIGELSYPVYLIHVLIIGFSLKIVNDSYVGELATLLSIIAAIFLVKFVEEPIDRIRQKRVSLKK